MIKGSIQEEDITIVNIYAPNIGIPQYIRQTLKDRKGETDSNTIRVGNFNTPLTSMDRSSKQKINKETQVLNYTLDEISLISSGHSIQMQKNTPSSQVHMEHSPGQNTSWVTNKTSVNLRKLKLYQASSPTTMLQRLDINYKKKTVKNTNTWRLNNTFLKNQQVTEEIKRENFLETNDNENTITQTYGMQQKQF